MTQHASFTGAVAVTFNQTMFDFSAVFPAVSFKSGVVCHSWSSMFSSCIGIKTSQFTFMGSVLVIRYLIAEWF